MKTFLTIATLFCAFAASAQVADEKQVTQRQPPLITEEKLARDEAMAAELRKKNENQKRPVKEEEKARKTEDAALTANTSKASSKRTSKKPGEQ